MIVVDTSVWIDFLRGKETASKLSALLDTQKVVAISPVFGELLQGVKTENELNIIEEYWSHLPKIIEMNLLIRAGKYSYNNKMISKSVGLIDCSLIVVAEDNGFKVWTFDKNLLKAMPKRLIYEP